MTTRRRYSIDPNGNIMVKDWPGDPREQDISDRYENVVPAGPEGAARRVEASLTVEEGPPQGCNFYDDGTPGGKSSRRELVRQVLADLGLPPDDPRAI